MAKKPSSSIRWFILFKLLPKMGTLLPKIFSTLLKLLKAFKGFKFGMAAATFGSYAWMFSWQFALLIMGSVFLHELGHIRAMKAYGMKTRGVYFLPFMGAAAVTEEDFPSRKAEAVIAIWGPLWGLMLSMIFFDIYAWTDNPLMAGVATWCAMVNLFNLCRSNRLMVGALSPLSSSRFPSVSE
jgi:Zn-dependent protease